MLELRERHRADAVHFDRLIEREYRGRRSYTFSNLRDYQALFSRSKQYRGVVAFFGDVKGRRILDAGCGIGWAALHFARSGADVYCCDVSRRSIQVARRFAGDNGLGDRVHADVMAAESLSYDNASFDFVFMNAALHHCDIATVSQEFHRVLKPGGKVALIEDYGYHPLFNLYRLLSPTTHTPHERALSETDVHLFVLPFGQWQADYFQLLDVWDKEWLLKPILSRVDDWLLGRIPSLRKYCRLVGIYAVK